MEESTMFYVCRYCVFTWDGRTGCCNLVVLTTHNVNQVTSAYNQQFPYGCLQLVRSASSVLRILLGKSTLNKHVRWATKVSRYRYVIISCKLSVLNFILNW